MPSEIQEYLDQLQAEFQRHANLAIAAQQKAYMKDNFEFFGLKTSTRRELSKIFLEKAYLPDQKDLNELIIRLWQMPQRDFQLFGLDLATKYKRAIEPSDLSMFEHMITTRSWWDTVDLVATHLVGAYLQKYPAQIPSTVDRWMASDNMWLQRTCVIFQLKYKSAVDTTLLTNVIDQLIGSKEFFINKAIGWMLREYTKTNAEWVVDFVNKTELSNLSRREALRLIK